MAMVGVFLVDSCGKCVNQVQTATTTPESHLTESRLLPSFSLLLPDVLRWWQGGNVQVHTAAVQA
jgi:hypothetical protein